jgi:hypothetical protein
MKKVLFSAIVAGFLFASCGSDVCDCVNAMEEMEKKMKDADGDMDKIKKVQEEYKDQLEKCEKLGEGKSEDEMKKLEEEAKNCK